jgi:hypothetical protein
MLVFNTIAREPHYSLEAIKQMTTDQQIFKLLELRTQYLNNIELFFLAIVLFLALFFITIESKPLSRLFGKLCRSVFYWGDMKADYDKYKDWKRNLGWIVLAGLIIALVAGFILRII